MKFGIVGNIDKPRARAGIQIFVKYLEKLGVDYVYSEDLVEFLDLKANLPVIPLDKIGYECQIVIAFGGDGTILSTANKVGKSGVPIVGVNVGALGFLAEVVVEELQTTVDQLLQGRYSIIERMVLAVDVHMDSQVSTYYALNDVVVDKGRTARMITAEVSVDGNFLNRFRSDGVIIATPTGSTAYSLSAGGPLLEPTMQAFIVTPICPHSLTERPIVLLGESVINVSLISEQTQAQINVDGHHRCTIGPNNWINIKKADYSLKWISTGKRNFYEILRTKLNWGADSSEFKKY